MSTEQEKKVRYRVTNWSKYNKALVNRGRLTIWMASDLLENWLVEESKGKVGHPFTYSDDAIECLLMLRSVYRLPYRQTQGLFSSLLELLDLDFAVPDYSTLCRRCRHQSIRLPVLPKEGAIDVVVDSTGVKVYGEGEWKVKIHGKSKRKTWRKLHLAVDAKSREIVGCATTTNDMSDHEIIKEVLDEIPEEQKINSVGGDGGYDYLEAHKPIVKRGAKAIIPPRKNARIWNLEEFKWRDHAIRRIREIGKKAWKIESGYHMRSLSETTIYRFKRIFGPTHSNISLANQLIENRIKCAALNIMTQLGMPETEVIHV